MAESIQKTLDRTRKPKVQIKYDVETYGAIEKKSLPFVGAVLADLSGDNDVTDVNGKKQPIKKRKFTEIDRDNFNAVLKASKPKASVSCADKLSGEEGKNLKAELTFEKLEDFHPEQIVQQVEPLRKLVEARQKLELLKMKMDGNDDLIESLTSVLQNVEVRDSLKGKLGSEKKDEEKPAE